MNAIINMNAMDPMAEIMWRVVSLIPFEVSLSGELEEEAMSLWAGVVAVMTVGFKYDLVVEGTAIVGSGSGETSSVGGGNGIGSSSELRSAYGLALSASCAEPQSDRLQPMNLPLSPSTFSSETFRVHFPIGYSPLESCQL